MQIIRTANENGTYRYEIDGQLQIKASKVLYTHASSYRVGSKADGPVLFHKTEAAAMKAKGYDTWVKTGVVTIIEG